MSNDRFVTYMAQGYDKVSKTAQKRPIWDSPHVFYVKYGELSPFETNAFALRTFSLLIAHDRFCNSTFIHSLGGNPRSKTFVILDSFCAELGLRNPNPFVLDVLLMKHTRNRRIHR